MQEILKKLNEVVGVCETRIQKLDTEKAEVASERARLKNQKEVQDAEQKRIDSENEALNKRKNIVKTLDEAMIILKNNSDERKRIKAESDNLEKRKIEHAKKVADDTAEIERKRKKLSDMNAETEKKAKDYRIEVMKSVLKESAASAGE